MGLLKIFTSCVVIMNKDIVQGMKKSNFFLQDLSIYKVQKVHILIQTECVPLQYFLDQDSLCLSRAVSIQ